MASWYLSSLLRRKTSLVTIFHCYGRRPDIHCSPPQISFGRKVAWRPSLPLVGLCWLTVPQGGLYGRYVDGGQQAIHKVGFRMVGVIKLVFSHINSATNHNGLNMVTPDASGSSSIDFVKVILCHLDRMRDFLSSDLYQSWSNFITSSKLVKFLALLEKYLSASP